MPSPEPYFDDQGFDYDPPPRGSPRLMGDLSRMDAIRSASEARESPGPPLTPRQRKIKRKHLIVLLCRVNGLPVSAIADAFDLTPRQIFSIVKAMGYEELRR